MRRATLAFAVLASCGPTPPPQPRVAPPPPPDPVAEPAAPPLVWRYHPAYAYGTRGYTKLPDDRWLLVGERGERWLSDAIPVPDPDGMPHDVWLEGTPYRAPEPLTSSVRLGDDRFLFVGQSGSLYTARSALGPLEQSLRPPEPLAKVVGVAAALLGITADGMGYRYQEGRGWTRVDTGRRFFDLAGHPSGQLLALAIPEALYSSSDGGATFTPVANAPPIGALSLFSASDGAFGISGMSESARYDPATGVFERGVAPVQEAEPPDASGLVNFITKRAPSVTAIDEGRGVLAGDRYYEVSARDEGGMQITAGRLRDALAIQPVAQLDDCAAYYTPHLGASGKHVVVACNVERETAQNSIVALFHSGDEGRTFSRVVELASSDPENVRVAVAPDGTALVSNACATDGDTCNPMAPLRISPGGKAEEVRAADLVQPPAGLVFGVEGRTAYFFGRRGKDGRYAFFASVDGGKTFRSRPLPVPEESDDPLAPYWDVDSDMPRIACPGDDGDVGVLLQLEPPVYALADRDGELGPVARLPEQGMASGCNGRDVLVFTSDTQDYQQSGQVVIWESLDAGLTFSEAQSPLNLTVDDFYDEYAAVRCAPGGCVIGSRITRAGWGEWTERVPKLEVATFEETFEPAVQTSIECQLDDKVTWTAIKDVRRNGYDPLPTANQAMRGDSTWSLLRWVPRTGELVAVSMGVDGRLTSDRLFAAAGDAKSFAYDLSNQMEGYAAARVRLKWGRAGEPGAPIGKLEVAWVNYITSESGRGATDSSSELGPDDISPDYDAYGLSAAPAVLRTGLISVSPGGVFLQPRVGGTNAYFFDIAGKRSDPWQYPAWPPVSFEVTGDAVAVDGHLVAVGKVGYDIGVLVAPVSGAAATVNAYRLSPSPDVVATTARWTYADRHVGVSVYASDQTTGQAWAHFAAYRADGALETAIAVPTQLDLPAQPAVCTPDQRLRTARMVVPWVSGTRRPVTVTGSQESYRLITDDAVIQGTPQVPCVAAYEANQLQTQPGGLRLIATGDLQQAWLFRPMNDALDAVEYRPATCRFAPGAGVPPEVWNEAGTQRPVR